MPCGHPLTRFVAGAMACVICSAVIFDEHPVYHLPEPGVYRPVPGPAFSISSNYNGGTAIAGSVVLRSLGHEREF
jgi:hypothetical protein